MMKSKEAKEFIDGCMDHLTVEMTDHAKWQLRAAMTRAAELAEQDTEQLMRQKAVEAFKSSCKVLCEDLRSFIQKLNEI
jgi:hypothetical protein